MRKRETTKGSPGKWTFALEIHVTLRNDAYMYIVTVCGCQLASSGANISSGFCVSAPCNHPILPQSVCAERWASLDRDLRSVQRCGNFFGTEFPGWHGDGGALAAFPNNSGWTSGQTDDRIDGLIKALLSLWLTHTHTHTHTHNTHTTHTHTHTHIPTELKLCISLCRVNLITFLSAPCYNIHVSVFPFFIILLTLCPDLFVFSSSLSPLSFYHHPFFLNSSVQ